MFWLERRNSALFKLIDNLLATIFENEFLMHDLITDKIFR